MSLRTRVATKEFTVFQDWFDNTPTFRSYILNLVVQFGGKNKWKLLQKYLEHVETVLKEITNRTSVRAELNNILISSIEQNYWNDINQAPNYSDLSEEPLGLAHSLLAEVEKYEETEIEALQMINIIAKIRVSFQIFVDYLKNPIKNLKNGENF